MARWIRQSTAFTFRVGPFVDSTDGVTAETALTIAQADIQISKAGGTFAQTSASPTTTHDADGWYQCPLTTTDTNTLGALTVQIVMSGALPVWEHFMVVPANVWDSYFGADLLDVSLVQIGGDAQSGTDLKDFADAGYDPATNKVEGVKLADTLTTYTGNTVQTGDSFARIAAGGAGLTALGDTRIANLDAAVSSRSTYAGGAVASVTGNVGGNVTGSIGSLAAQAKLDVNAEADTALSDYGALKPTTAGRTLDVSATGEAGLDFDNVKQATGATTLTNITVPVVSLVNALGADSIDSTAVASSGATEIANAVGATVVEGTTTVLQSLRLANSANGGKADGMATTTGHLRDLADTKNRVTATVDANGNRTAVTLDLT